MIRVLVVGSILLIAQAVPAFAEKVSLKCGDEYFVFDSDAHSVTFRPYRDEIVEPARITDAEVTWQHYWPDTGQTDYWNYDRNAARLHWRRPSGRNSVVIWSALDRTETCVGGQKPPRSF